jgi:hypothetical protein
MDVDGLGRAAACAGVTELVSVMFFDRNIWLMMLSASLLSLLCVLETTRDLAFIFVISNALNLADTLFHELGHSLFAWLFGMPSIPSILTLFGADKAGGITLAFERIVLLQLVSLAGLGYLCFRLWRSWSPFLVPVSMASLLILVLSVTDYYMLLVSYMGHAASIFMGGFFVFRSMVNLHARHAFERWLNALFGSFLLLDNFRFSFGLVFDAFERQAYSGWVNGVGHNDFVKIAREFRWLEITHVAAVTMLLCLVVVGVAYLQAVRFESSRRLAEVVDDEWIGD